MGRVGLTIEQPNLTPPTGWSGLITDVTDYVVQREVSRAGTWTARVRATAQQASAIRTGWKVSITEERTAQNPNLTLPQYVLRRGRVLRRNYMIDRDGSGILELSGETWLGQFANNLVPLTQTFTNKSIGQIATTIQGFITDPPANITVPSRTGSQPLNLELSDQTALACLLKLADYTHCSLVEDWDATTWVFTDQNDVPAAAGNTFSPNGELYLRQVERGDPQQSLGRGYGPELYGVGIIQGLPAVTYEGSSIANRIIGVGTDFDGGVLTLQGAFGYDSLYNVASTTIGGQTFYYIEDSASVTAHGRVELQFVRSDVKVPNNNQSDRQLARAALFAVAQNELLKRRSETMNVSVQVANGDQLQALPGYKCRIRYKGRATLPDGRTTWLDIDQWMLIMSRRDTSSLSGARLVQFDLVAPTIQYTVPNLPNAVQIPTPLPRDKSDSSAPSDPSAPDGSGDGPTDPNALTKAVRPIIDQLKNQAEGSGAYQPCCADPGADMNAGAVPPQAGLGLTTGIFSAHHVGDVGAGPVGGNVFTTPPAADNSVKRAYLVMVWKSTGIPTSATGTWTKFFDDLGGFTVWAYSAAAGGGGAPGLVTVPVSSPDGIAASWRADVDTSTANVKYNMAISHSSPTNQGVYLAVYDERGTEKALTPFNDTLPQSYAEPVSYTP